MIATLAVGLSGPLLKLNINTLPAFYINYLLSAVNSFSSWLYIFSVMSCYTMVALLCTEHKKTVKPKPFAIKLSWNE
jgi:hypothetical protein